MTCNHLGRFFLIYSRKGYTLEKIDQRHRRKAGAEILLCLSEQPSESEVFRRCKQNFFLQQDSLKFKIPTALLEKVLIYFDINLVI
jgi:hypothetical protein